MAPRKGWQRALGNALSMATNMAAAIALGYFAGKYLDNKLGTEPWLTLLLFLLGVATGLKIVYDRAFAKKRNGWEWEQDKESDNKIKVKPGEEIIEALKAAREGLRGIEDEVKSIHPSPEDVADEGDGDDKTREEDDSK